MAAAGSEHGVRVLFPSPALCTDNGAMIARAGASRLVRGERTPLDVAVDPGAGAGRMTTYMVTGGAGFIGSHLCDRLLAEGHRVIAVDDLSTGRIANLSESRGYGKEFTFFNMDLRADGLLSLFERHRPEVVMHLGAQSSVAVSMEDPVRDASVNAMGSLNVLECARRSGARKVVYAASGGTLYGDPRKLPVKETALGGGRPVSPYGISKKVVLDYLSFYERYHGIEWTALALANVYGPRQDPQRGGRGHRHLRVGRCSRARRRRSSATGTRRATTSSWTTSSTRSRWRPTAGAGGS